MKIIKTTSDYTIIKKRSGRYGVFTKQRKWLNGDAKVDILLREGLINVSSPKGKEDESTSSDSSEEGAPAGA